MNTDRNFNTLPSGKKLGIYKVANTALYTIAFTSGGELPAELSGAYTDAYQAQRAIERYLNRKEMEEAEKAQKEALDELVSEAQADGAYSVDKVSPTIEEAKSKPIAKKKTSKKKSVKTKE